MSAEAAYSSNMSQENDSQRDDNSWLLFNNSSTGESTNNVMLTASAVNAATTALFEKCEENAKILKAKGLATSNSIVDGGYTIEEEDLKKILREHDIDPSVFTSVMAAFPSTLQGKKKDILSLILTFLNDFFLFEYNLLILTLKIEFVFKNKC